MSLKPPFLKKRRPNNNPDAIKQNLAQGQFGNPKNVPRELGFGTGITEEVRLINKDGSFNVKRIGRSVFHPYYSLTTMPWLQFNLLVLTTFLTVNIFFALLYVWVGVDQLAGIEPGGSALKNFLEAFYFSCQTFTSVGYGRVNPIGLISGMISSIEALVGLLALALATGLLFARFARPEAKLVFSKNALISPYQDDKAFMFKFANMRENQLIEVEVQVTFSAILEENGKAIRQFFPMTLAVSKVNFFPLSWTIVHPITDDSPLRNFRTWDDLQKSNAEILISIKAFDDSFSETVYSRHSYLAEEIVWGAKYPTVFYPENGTVVLDLSRMDEFVKVKLPQEAEIAQ